MHHSFVLEFLRPMQRQLFEASFLEKYFTKSTLHEFKQCCWNVVPFSAIWIAILASGTHVTVVFLFLSLALLTAPKWEKQIVFSIQDLLRSGGKQDLKGSQIGAFYGWAGEFIMWRRAKQSFWCAAAILHLHNRLTSLPKKDSALKQKVFRKF